MQVRACGQASTAHIADHFPGAHPLSIRNVDRFHVRIDCVKLLSAVAKVMPDGYGLTIGIVLIERRFREQPPTGPDDRPRPGSQNSRALIIRNVHAAVYDAVE